VDGDLLTLEPLSALLVEPASVGEVFNDSEAVVLWAGCGDASELANTLEMTVEQLAQLYADGPKALPPELGG
jgi:hypothetical protein